MVAVAYRIPLAGRAIPALEKFIKRREVHYIESPYPNNCFFEALSYLSKLDQEGRLRPSDRVAEGVKLMIQYYELQGNSAKCKTVQQFITNYQGFNIARYNSAHFDMIFVLPYLTNSNWRITSYLGDFSHIKRVTVKHKISGVSIQFLDAILFITKESLKQFAIDFGDGGKDGNKGVFPYDAINTENYKEVLEKKIPFSQEDFNNKLRGEQISDDDYKLYLEDSKNFNNRWDYLQYYNELDTTIMIKPIDRLIEMNFSNGIDMFNYVSMASCANSIKYKMACQDFDLNSRYVNKDDSSLICYQPFEFTYDYWCRKVGSYNIQDLKAGRDRNYNINESDYEYYKELIKTSSCWFCKAKFTILNQPTLDRIDNSLGHSKDNVRFACQYCNVARSNRDAKITRLKIQLKRYYLAKGLPCPITSEDTYHILRNGITGGLANTFHRYNIKGETHINKMKLDNNQVISYDLDNIMTYITGVDFNSLYPAVFSGLNHHFIKYTGHQIYMPVRCLDSSKFHFIYEDTDSMMLAVAGNPNKDYNQGFSEIITDQQFYDENFYKFFPDPSKGVYDEKKLLGVAYEHCGSSLIALVPKNYWLLEDLDKKHPQTVKLKGLNLKSNPQINKDAYENNIRNGTVVQGKNISLRQYQGKMSQIEVFKNGITELNHKLKFLMHYSKDLIKPRSKQKLPKIL
ncbi:MAG: hypothetical protein EZS28_024485 [Streblomastix strix]|uniref:Uncharacterized protein n=1 Tax=Streblomastix strix TaxID=222440 RepID=A0A5J4VBS6_9EUKA|nr:MAG: hypothetical protein EZS28_024485 [Streblomastix strix]